MSYFFRKKPFYCLVAMLLSQGALYAQWSTSGSTVYSNAGNVCVGTSVAGWSRFSMVTSDGGSQPQIGAQAGGSAQGQRAVFSLFPTFQGTSDNAPRRAADIVGGFNGCPWGCEYLSFNVGIGGVNDSGNLNTERMRITGAGNVGIGTTNPLYPLSVNGTIQAKEVLVNTGWSDYVFDQGYHLRSLESTAAYIKHHHHLPDIPSAADVQARGVAVGEVESKLLAKVEEITLHMIELEQRDTELRRKNRELQSRIVSLEKMYERDRNQPAAPHQQHK